MEHVAGTATIIVAPLTMLAGTFYAVFALDEPFPTLSLANPVFHIVDAFRSAFTGQAEGYPVFSVLALAALNALLIWTVIAMLRSGYRLKD